MRKSEIGLPKGITTDDAYIQGIADTEDRQATQFLAFIRDITVAIYLIDNLMAKASLGFIERNNYKRAIADMRAHRDQMISILQEQGNVQSGPL